MSDLFSLSNLPGSTTQLASEIENKQFLRFFLRPDTNLMLPIRQITEVLKIQFGQIVPIPQMPPWVMGVYNWRGDILWMIDLGNLVGLNSWYQQELNRSSQTVIVLSPDQEQTKSDHQSHLGLVISRVEDIESCDPTTIQIAIKETMSQLEPFLQGYWLKPSGEMILVLDGKSIVAAMPREFS